MRFFKLLYNSDINYTKHMGLASQFYRIHTQSNYKQSKDSKFITIISFLLLLFSVKTTDFTDNTCTFKIDGKLFSLAYLNRNAKNQQLYYTEQYDNDTYVDFNFCEPFVPKQCSGQNLPYAYSYLVRKQSPIDINQSIYECTPYSSDSKISNFMVEYSQQNNDGNILKLILNYNNAGIIRQTSFVLGCNEATDQILEDIVVNLTDNMLTIQGKSPYACPIFTMQSIWQALDNNKIIFGILLFIIGFIMLFYGVLMIHLMVFLATFFMSFAALLGLFSAFLNPQSSKAIIYFSLLFILFLSTLIAYGLAKIVNFSVFFIGAFFGFILAALINTMFVQIFSVYSIWSLIIFEVIFTIPFGLLTFKYNKQIIAFSTSLAGAYMVVRPFSWLFGGFPNEFTLYQSIQTGSANALSWSFFIYYIFILAIFAVGAHYQLLKIARKNNDLDQNNYLPGAVQDHLDRIHQHVQNLINKYSNHQQTKQNYNNMDAQITPSNIQVRPTSKQQKVIQLQPIKRKSKQNDL